MAGGTVGSFYRLEIGARKDPAGRGGQLGAGAEGFGEAVDRIEPGENQVVGALAQAAAGLAPVGSAVAQPEDAEVWCAMMSRLCE